MHVSTHRSLHQEIHTYAHRILSRSTCMCTYLPHTHGDVCSFKAKHSHGHMGSSKARQDTHMWRFLLSPEKASSHAFTGQKLRELGSHTTTKSKPDSWSRIVLLWNILGKIHIQSNVQVSCAQLNVSWFSSQGDSSSTHVYLSVTTQVGVIW